MLRDDIEKMKQLLDAVKFEQPEKDVEVEDAGGEPVNFNKKADQNHGMDKVSDEELKPTKLEDTQSTMHSVAKTIDVIEPEDKKLVQLAIEQGLLSDGLPSAEDMAEALLDTNIIKSGTYYAEVYQKYLAGTATVKEITKAYIKGVLLPVLKSRKPQNNGIASENTLHICNACTKVFRASEAKCTGCKSENTELILKEDFVEFNLEEIYNSPPQCDSIDELDKMIDDTIKEWDTANSDEKSKRHIIGRGLSQEAAEELARKEEGQAVVDDEDEDKTGKVFMVITKEKPNV